MPPGPHRGICLLPYFDAYLVAGQPRDRLYPGAADARALTPAGQARTTGPAGRRRGRRGVASAALRAQKIRSCGTTTITPMRQHLHQIGGYHTTGAASDHHVARPTFLSVSEPNADSVLEDRQLQASRMAPISAFRCASLS